MDLFNLSNEQLATLLTFFKLVPLKGVEAGKEEELMQELRKRLLKQGS